jgi:predicted LPLAT superfamily acyltransferase
MNPATSKDPTTDAWLTAGERGTVLGMRAMFWLARVVGRRATKPLVAMIALWYRLFDRRATASSAAWLQRVTGQRPGFWAVYRHLQTFAQVTLDKLFLLQGRAAGLQFQRHGDELLQQQVQTGQGAMLLGAHVGSYEAMRVGGNQDGIHIEILAYTRNARMINALLAQIDPAHAAKIIDLGGDAIEVMTRVQEAVQRGHLIAAMADRIGLGRHVVPAPFCGATAQFSGGPFVLASVLRCPVYLVFGIYHAPGRYELFCERFADRIELPRRDRQAALAAVVARYASRVEHFARLHPYNWFNFFDFWAPPRPPEAMP